MRKIIISFILAMIKVLPTTTAALTYVSFAEASLPFEDVQENNWFYDEVKTVYEHGIMNGRGKTVFAPGQSVTRAETVTILSRLAGADVSGMENELINCPDIAADAWYAKYAAWGISSGIVKGYEDGTFRAGKNVSRAELSALLVRFIAFMELNIEDDNPTEKFTDAESVADWAKDYVEAIRKTGIMIGDGKGCFNPDATATRAEIAAIASRLIGYIYEKRLEQGNVMLTIDSETVPEEKAFSALITEKFDAEGFFDSVSIQNYDDIKDTLEDFTGGETTEIILNAVFTKCDMIIPVSYTVNVKVGLPDSSGMLKPDGERFYYAFKEEFSAEAVFARWLKEKSDLYSVYDSAVLADFASVKSFAEDLAVGSADTLNITVTFSKAGENDVVRTYSVQFTRLDAALDPTPDNVGIMYEENGIKISEFIDAGAYLQNESLGYHGGHDTRVVRNEYGTYMVFLDSMKYDENYPEGSQYSDYFYWTVGSIYKIKANGVEKIYSFEYPRTMCAAPNIIAGDNGMLYITAIADDKERYLESGLTDEGAWLGVYELDSKTDTVRKTEIRTDFEYHWNEVYTGGYGYSQPLLDRENGKLYLFHTAGNPTGYTAYFTYDIYTHEFVGGCKTIVSDFAAKYLNLYTDGNGGIIIIAQRDLSNKVLTDYYSELYGRPIMIGNGSENSYVWDALYLYHITNPEDVSTCSRIDVAIPDYINNLKDDGYCAKLQCIKHYAGGCTYMDTERNLHIIYNHQIGSTYTTYHVIYDRDLNEVYRKKLAPAFSTKYKYNVNLTQSAGGKYYLILEPLQGVKMKLEIWESDNGRDFTKAVSVDSLIDPSTGANFSCQDKMIIGSGRNYSIRDGVIPVIFGNSSGDRHYYYFSIEVPD